MIIFIHIPKTAGTSMRKIIEKQYTIRQIRSFYAGYEDAYNKLKGTPNSRLSSVKWVQGHFQFGLHEVLPQPAQYIAMLRHPVDRVISFYYFLRESPRHPLNKKAMSLTLKEFIMCEDSDIQSQIYNLQTKMISGDGTPSLEKAKKNIEQHFLMVGITERFNESMAVMRKKLGWNVPYNYKHNVTKRRPKMEQVPAEIRKLIEQKNEIDFQLYEYGKALLQKEINSLK
ncbi:MULTISPECIES: sulfotransferase family 2 domain-containing protein [unclassified Cytobacillus]|uniref:sulfotransferase family 2 domain-containing protein n=1 Tax=unclassified Cytobacillus TaxID=2675268 RepID=UPI00288C1756|nr:sulfotransferase family 2 domain-containing protein [Cytobacillus sp. AMY 15.2]